MVRLGKKLLSLFSRLVWGRYRIVRKKLIRSYNGLAPEAAKKCDIVKLIRRKVSQ
jgi:hypothetical protein